MDMRFKKGDRVKFAAPSGEVYTGVVNRDLGNEVEMREVGQFSGRVIKYTISKKQIVEKTED